MENVKEVLFEEALYHRDEMYRLKNELGEWDRLYALASAKYSALLVVIEESGLLYEWEEYRRTQR